ncbi:unnamed protein product [Litomosoides sigmodontis]|uniref:Uncharacterized protein n=1 Tax=Litomosoides sigmodontis TaxID=42156 RepID=A0A3P6T2A3_LITSI|nr:unnamed protein product [Litomosoides sigmodontis]
MKIYRAINFVDATKRGFRIVLLDSFLDSYLAPIQIPTLFITAVPLRVDEPAAIKIFYPDNIWNDKQLEWSGAECWHLHTLHGGALLLVFGTSLVPVCYWLALYKDVVSRLGRLVLSRWCVSTVQCFKWSWSFVSLLQDFMSLLLYHCCGGLWVMVVDHGAADREMLDA